MARKNLEQPERLQKYLAKYGYASRRKIEELIREGRIKIDGVVAELGSKVTSKNEITIFGRRFKVPTENLIDQQNTSDTTRLLVYNKPIGTICTTSDPQGRETVFDDLPKLKYSKWINIGRLDINTSGLLLFTNNGELANQLMHPSNNYDREYLVRVLGEVDKVKLNKLLEGIKLDDGVAKFKKITKVDKPVHNSTNNEIINTAANQWYKVILTEGKNREVRRLWEAVDCKVSRLMRIGFGPYKLPRDLRAGEYAEINQED